MNHLNEKDCGKFVDDMAAVGIDLKEFVYGEYTLENWDIHIILWASSLDFGTNHIYAQTHPFKALTDISSRCMPKNYFSKFLFLNQSMLWVLKRTVSLRRFF